MSHDQPPPHNSSAIVKRRLAAILAADVKGYSRLMGEDEVATLQTLTASRAVTDALIAQHHGRIVGTAGDSILAEFASVIDAVQGAVEIQRALKAKNAELPEHRRMEFRIGINLGDVMVEGEQIYGDGVNIAARLEALADGGGICISGVVHDQVKNKLVIGYEDLGEQRVKNIAEPVRVWRIQAGQSDSPKSQVPSPKLRRAGTTHRVWAVVAGVALIGGGIMAVRYLSHPPLSPQSSSLITEEAKPPLPLPDKPSIAVLPFVNMSEDPKQEYFSDGITEDLITDLSRLSGLFVISRNSAFTYKGKAVKVQDVGKELGVRYVLEGSVRKADDQVRITAQLVDAATDHHIWAERYDRPLQDIFAVQDEIVRKIVTTLKLQLTLEESGILVRKTTDNLEAYDYFLRGTEYSRQFTKEANAQARQMFERAVELDPQYAEACARTGWTYWVEWSSQWNRDPQILERAQELAQKALTLDEALPIPHRLLSQIYLNKMRHDQAIAEAERALALDPNWAEGYVNLAIVLRFSGRAEEAVEIAKKAMRLNPHYPPLYQYALGFSYCQVGQYKEAITTQKDALSRNPNMLFVRICLAACYSMAGRDEEARAQVQEVLRISPNYSLEAAGAAPWKNPADGKAMIDALRRAGLK